ncbi:MAG: phosphoenolpyruvate synthase [Actinomycetota bacterium]
MAIRQKTLPYVLWFDEMGIKEVPQVGGKSASLGEMTSKTNVPVPYGFATTAQAYWHFAEEGRIKKTIADLLDELKDPNDTQVLQRIGSAVRKTMLAAKMPDDLKKEIKRAYKALAEKVGEEEPFVAVRSSATAEDLPDASFAGQQETYLNIRGADNVVEKIKECYSSLFTDRVIFYRTQKGFDHMNIALSASIQMMVYSKASGVIFTLDVSNGDPSVVLMEAGYGLGEYIVGGKIVPDEYYVKKSDLSIVRKNIAEKPVMLVRNPRGGTMEKEVPAYLASKPVLTDDQIKELAQYAIDIENHYGRPMDIEWALDERTNKLFIVQARPETVWAEKAAPVALPKAEAPSVAVMAERRVLVQGLPASPGVVSGKVHVIDTVDKLKEFKEGEILVTEMTAPDWVPAMRKSKAIVTDSGGMTAHAAIVSREMGIPCVVGTKSKGPKATEVLKTGMDITVDAGNGVVYEGVVEELLRKAPKEEAGIMVAETFPVTGTKVYMNLGDPDLAEKYASLPADGIGLMREEFIWTSFIGEHPLYLIEIGQSQKVVDQLAEGIRKVCQPMSPRPVVLRFSDFKTSEYRDLKGGEKYEPQEPSSLLGWRGASRYYDPKYKEAFKLEIKAVRKVREEFGLMNLWVMIPFCRTVEECKRVLAIMEEEGLRRGPDFKVWIMAEIPSNIILADQFNSLIDGYSVGSNDLTMLILGADRDNETVARIFDERDLAVKRAIKHLIEVAHRDGKTVSICGQAPSVYEDFTVFLVKAGIDSISVNPDAVKATKKLVASVEQRLLIEKATGQELRPTEDLTW